MIVKEILNINGRTIYRNYSDRDVLIQNKETGLLYSTVNSSIDYEYLETDIPINQEDDDKD